MRIDAMFHETKSKYSYAVDPHTIHVWFRTAKNDCESIEIIAGDPYNWIKGEDDVWRWEGSTSEKIKMSKKYTTRLHDYYFGVVTSKSQRVRYGFKLTDNDDVVFFGARYVHEHKNELPYEQEYDIFNYFNYPFINKEDIFSPPSWVESTVWYQIFPDRFCNVDNPKEGLTPWDYDGELRDETSYGGNIKGVISKLDYLEELGVNGIYFTPLVEGYSFHKYDTTNYYKIDPTFGTNEDFKKLVEEAHKRGIRVMLDAVFNHSGWFHPFWQDVVKNGKESKYVDCFHIIDKDNILKGVSIVDGKPVPDYTRTELLGFHTFAYAPWMPKWNTDHPLVQEELLGAAKYWIEEYDIDGWRLDVSNEVSHDFWRKFHDVVKSTKKDVFITGENMDFAEAWVGPDQFDSVMNYDLAIPIYGFMTENKQFLSIDKQSFMETIQERLVAYPSNVQKTLYNVLDTHDTDRLLSMVGDDIKRVRIPILFMMTLAGSPSVYYGTEKLMSGMYGYHECRRPLPWDLETENTKSMFTFMQILIKARRNNSVFRDVDIQFIDTDHDQVIAYHKENDTQDLHVVINNSNEEVTVTVNASLTEALNVFTNQTESLLQKVTLPAYGYKVLLNNK